MNFREKRIRSRSWDKVEVSDLFFNTPARLKFLKKPKSEEGEITNLIAKLILANLTFLLDILLMEKLFTTLFVMDLLKLYILFMAKKPTIIY